MTRVNPSRPAYWQEPERDERDLAGKAAEKLHNSFNEEALKKKWIGKFKKQRWDAERVQNKKEQVHQNKNDKIIEVQLYEDKVDRAQSSLEALHIAIEGLKTLKETIMQTLFSDARALQSTE